VGENYGLQASQTDDLSRKIRQNTGKSAKTPGVVASLAIFTDLVNIRVLTTM
jgi:hypothetical protein